MERYQHTSASTERYQHTSASTERCRVRSKRFDTCYYLHLNITLILIIILFNKIIMIKITVINVVRMEDGPE